jgi:putative hemolysin
LVLSLINKDEFIQASQLDKYKLSQAAPLIMYLLKLSKLNRFYDRLDKRQSAVQLLDQCLEHLNIRIDLPESDRKKIPAQGPFLTVSNHPFGMLDGLILLRIVTEVHTDYKVMANFLLQRLEPWESYIIPVNPFESQRQVYQSVGGIKQMLYWLREGHPAGLFPAGEVSTYQPDLRTVTDRAWQTTALRLVQKARVPVLPIYFSGQNSRLFHLLGSIHPALRTATIPAEFFRKKNKSIQVRIGYPISVEEQDEFAQTERLGRYLRARTYALGSALEVKKFYMPRLLPLKQPQRIIDPIPRARIEAELAKCKPVFSQREFDVYLAESTDIPETLNEIGRLRELTFRAAGEGSNRRLDIDEYDLYYHHLFLWDRQQQELAGAYRLGLGREIDDRYGVRGFYINSLFQIDEAFRPILSRAVEMGRSFVVEAYQQKTMPLFLLWRGILGFIQTHTDHRYLIGPVSISNDYSKLSKRLLMAFIRKYYYDEALAQYIRPRKELSLDVKLVDPEIMVEPHRKDLLKLDQLIEDVEPQHFRVPVLLKKYIKQNAKIIGFNIDPKFNYTLDGLMLLDFSQVNTETIHNLERRVSHGNASES